jgi:hypothetical protein
MKRNSKTAQKKRKGNGKLFGTSRGVMPQPTRTFEDRKKKANKRNCRDWKKKT